MLGQCKAGRGRSAGGLLLGGLLLGALLLGALLLGAFTGGCTPGVAPDIRERIATAETKTGRSLSGFENHFLLTWRDARIGEAVERVGRRQSGWRYQRHERIVVRRGDELVPISTHIAIDMNAHLRAERVTIKQISGADNRRGQAVRESGSGVWLVDYGDEPRRRAPAEAVPAELVSVLLYARPRTYHNGEDAWRGPVLLPGHGFAVADMRVVSTGARAFAITIAGQPVGRSLSGGAGSAPRLRGRWQTTRYGSLARAEDDNGVVAVRAHPRELAAPFTAPEMVLTASIPVRGIRAGGAIPSGLLIDSAGREAPPPLPGQRVRVRGQTWWVQLARGDRFAPVDTYRAVRPVAPRFRDLAERIVAEARGAAGGSGTRAEIAALARATDELIDDDLGAGVTDAHTALTLGRGDCTAHATLFYELAQARGIPAWLVTGYRLDGARLVRHRWALVAVDGFWMAVDPTHGEVPASARLLGLAIHGPAAAELTLIDETVFAGFADAVARVADEPAP